MSVLWSKLRMPSTTAGIIDRPRLVETIVSSPAPVWVVMILVLDDLHEIGAERVLAPRALRIVGQPSMPMVWISSTS